MKLSEVDKAFFERVHMGFTKPTMGGDPEFFIADAQGKIINADRFLPSKHEPLEIEDVSDGRRNKVFFDGIQAEIAPHYSHCRELLIDNIFKCISKVATLIPSDFKFVMRPSARIRKSIIESADPEARIFGCEPDFNAYTCGINTVEMDASRHPFRYAGGHMHFGAPSAYTPEDSIEYQLAKTERGHLRLIKFMDMLISLPTIAFDQDKDARRRRTKYGKAGCFRPTPYGIEYRSQSCWWMKSPVTASLVYGLGRLAWFVATKDMDEHLRNITGLDDDTVRGIIDETDIEYAYKMWTRLRAHLAITSIPKHNPLHIGASSASFHKYGKYNPTESESLPYKGISAEQVYGLAAFEYLLKNGLETIINPDIRQEWRLNNGSFVGHGHGFASGTYNALATNKDFQKFQSSFFKELGFN